jgi:TfoX/Sxy family transcriptional regulator of competence genes
VALDEAALERVRARLAERRDVVERRMVGGRSFVVGGHLCVGVSGGALMVRVGPDAEARVLAEPGVRPLLLGGKHPVGYVLVDPPGFRSDTDLARWIERGLEFVATLPPAAGRVEASDA